MRPPLQMTAGLSPKSYYLRIRRWDHIVHLSSQLWVKARPFGISSELDMQAKHASQEEPIESIGGLLNSVRGGRSVARDHPEDIVSHL